MSIVYGIVEPITEYFTCATACCGYNTEFWIKVDQTAVADITLHLQQDVSSLFTKHSIQAVKHECNTFPV